MMVRLALTGGAFDAVEVADLPILPALPVFASPADLAKGLLCSLPVFASPADLAKGLLCSFLTGLVSLTALVSFLAGGGTSRPVGSCAKAVCVKTSTESRAARSVGNIVCEVVLPIMIITHNYF